MLMVISLTSLQTEDDGDLGISLGGYVKKSDDVTIKVHWLPHPLNSDSSIDVWTFVIKKVLMLVLSSFGCL